MRLMRLILINMKRQLKNPGFLLIGLVMPVIMVISIFGGDSKEENKVLGRIGIIDKSNSAYSEELIENLSKRYKISNMVGQEEREGDYIRQLIMDDKLTVVYEIGEDFQEVIDSGKIPKIKCFKTEATTGTIIAEDIITSFVNGKVQEGLSTGLSTNAVTTEITSTSKDKGAGNLTTMVLLLCYFMMMGGSILTEDLIKLKSQKVLRRTISTANSDKQVLGSIFISVFLIQGVITSIGFIIVRRILNINYGNLPLIILVIFLGSLIATATIAASTRWIKNPILASLFMVIYSLIIYGLGMFGSISSSLENVPAAITRISAISPFAWMYKMLNEGELLLPSIVIILMALVFFTAGSFRLRDFAKE